MAQETLMTGSLPIGAYMHRGYNTYDPRISQHEQSVLDQHVNVLQDLVKKDHGLPAHKKKHFNNMLGGPEYAERIFSGFSGAMLARSMDIYSRLSPPAQTLLNLAGFGIGNIIYNEFHENKFTDYDKNSGKAQIKF